MSKKGILKQIYNLAFNTDEEAKENFIDVKSGDGILRVDDIAVGSPIQWVTEEGLEDTPDGEYPLEDGTILVVEGGIISEVKAVEEEDAPVDEEMSEEATEVTAETINDEVVEDAPVDEDLTNEQTQELVDKIREILETFESVNSKLEALTKDNEELKTRVAKFAGEPSVESTKVKGSFSNNKTEDKFSYFSKHRQKNK